MSLLAIIIPSQKKNDVSAHHTQMQSVSAACVIVCLVQTSSSELRQRTASFAQSGSEQQNTPVKSALAAAPLVSAQVKSRQPVRQSEQSRPGRCRCGSLTSVGCQVACATLSVPIVLEVCFLRSQLAVQQARQRGHPCKVDGRSVLFTSLSDS